MQRIGGLVGGRALVSDDRGALGDRFGALLDALAGDL